MAGLQILEEGYRMPDLIVDVLCRLRLQVLRKLVYELVQVVHVLVESVIQLLPKLQVKVERELILLFHLVEDFHVLVEHGVACVHRDDDLTDHRDTVSHHQTAEDHYDDGQLALSIVVLKHLTVTDSCREI